MLRGCESAHGSAQPDGNHKQGGGRKRLVPLFLIIGLLLAAALLPLFPRLAVDNERTGKTLLVLPIERGETFSIRFTHSVNLSDVTDRIEWTGDALVCRSTTFTDYGWGIPVLADGVGTTFSQDEDGFTVDGIDRAEQRILILLQAVPDHRLLYRDRVIELIPLAGSGALLRLSVRRVPLWQVLLVS